MDIKVKFKLIDFLYLSPEELPYLTQIDIPESIVGELLKDNIEALYNYLESLQEDEKLDESYRLFIACLKRRVTPLRINWDINEKDDEVENEDSDNYGYYNENLSDEEKQTLKEIEKQNNKMWRDREIACHKSVAKLEKCTQDEVNYLMLDYMWQKFPSLQNGFDRKTFLLARYSYYEDISINWHRYQLPAEVNKKLGIAEEYAKQEIINRFQKMETEKIEEWAREYICWMNQISVEYTSIPKLVLRLSLKQRN